ncbi:peptide ABC transporter permease [Limnoraphis robusta CS-951]|uniref:Peptide ABC transporter permease n=1 Tax=Limnoraphis robusta CS-951 TaxID=1637645 RepID=A0A0J9EXM2_9CYAN|nr:peptide ABC transporter permease [Limnoraphis robusta CS-951]
MISQTATPDSSPENLPSGPLNPRPDPNRDRFLQPSPEPPQPPQPSQPDIQPEPPTDTQPSPETPPIPVTTIEVTGSTILKPSEIEAIVAPLEGRSVTLAQLQEAADQITEIYLERGYITSRAIVPEQTISQGVVRIQVIEGILERIDIEGTQRLDPDYIRDRVQLGAGQPLSTARLEDQLRLLRTNPLFETVEASLRAGTQEGQSILIVRVTEAPPFQAGISADNYSPPSIGSERLGLNLRHLNLTGRGDLIFVSYNTTRLITEGESDILDVLYSLPVNAMNGTIQLRIPPYWNTIIQEPFDELNIDGKSQRYEISYRQPLIRTPVEELALSIGYAYQRSQTFQDGEGIAFGLGPEEDGVTRTSVFKFGQDYIRRDRFGAWALRSQFSIGTGLLGATNTASLPNSNFLSWLGQVQRVQRVGEDHLLILQGDVQLSADALFPSQQFVIGGGLSVRGYRQNVRSGDNGFRVSVEDRFTLLRDESEQPKLQLAPFLDVGTVWNHDENPNRLFGRTFLVGVGMGLLWEPLSGLNLRLDYGVPLVELQDRGNNIQDDGFYFSITYTP